MLKIKKPLFLCKVLSGSVDLKYRQKQESMDSLSDGCENKNEFLVLFDLRVVNCFHSRKGFIVFKKVSFLI